MTELLTLQPSTKTTTLGTQEDETRGVKYMRVGVKALEWMSGWTPRLCSHELCLSLLPCSTFSLTVVHYMLTKSNVDPWFRSDVLYNAVPSWRYSMSVSF